MDKFYLKRLNRLYKEFDLRIGKLNLQNIEHDWHKIQFNWHKIKFYLQKIKFNLQ